MTSPNAPSVRQLAADAITYHPGNRTGTPEQREAVSYLLADEVLRTLGIREWRPLDGDERCQSCGRENPCWSAPSDLWNAVVRVEAILCPTCFLLRAQAAQPDAIFTVGVR